jgi:hypothetical protein
MPARGKGKQCSHFTRVAWREKLRFFLFSGGLRHDKSETFLSSLAICLMRASFEYYESSSSLSLAENNSPSICIARRMFGWRRETRCGG